MSDTVSSTATTVSEEPVKKPRLSTRAKIAIAAGATTIVAAAVVVLKVRSDDEDSETVLPDEPPVTVEYLSDLDS